jgi:hypothetical protein
MPIECQIPDDQPESTEPPFGEIGCDTLAPPCRDFVCFRRYSLHLHYAFDIRHCNFLSHSSLDIRHSPPAGSALPSGRASPPATMSSVEALTPQERICFRISRP